MAQYWLRDASLESALSYCARQFHPAQSLSAPLAPEPTPNPAHAGGLIHQDLTLVMDATVCAMEDTIYSEMQAMERRLCERILNAQSILIAVAKGSDSLSAITIHSAIQAMKQRVANTINGVKSVLIAAAYEPKSSTVPDNTDTAAHLVSPNYPTWVIYCRKNWVL